MRAGIKRIIAVAVVMIMCLQMLVMADGVSYESDKNYTYFTVLSKLGILPESFEDADTSKAITRGEFAYLAAAAFGYPTSNSNKHFSDVDYSAEYAGAVMSLHDAGIVNGNANGSFYPEDAINPTDAAAILTRILGYSIVSQQYGGYAAGYLVAANDVGLFKGVANNGVNISVSDAVRLVFNALTVNRMENLSGGVFEQWEVTENSSRLLKTYGLRYGSGVVERNAYTALDDTAGYIKSYVSIGGVKYYDPEGMAQGLLGYHTDFLYEEDDNGGYNIFLIFASRKNNVTRMSAEDIYKIKEQTIYFDADGEDRTADINFNASVIYNEVADLESNGIDFIPEYGEITLIDNDDNYEYDVVFVSAYETYVVLGADDTSITDINGSVKDFSSIRDDRLFVYKNGEQIPLTAIQANNVVSVCFSKNNDSVTIYVSDEKVKGVLKETFDNKYTIDEATYTVSQPCMDAMNIGAITMPKVTDEVVAYLDFKGNIVYFEEEKFNGYMYGYVVAYGEPESSLQETKLRVINNKAETDDIVLEKPVTVNLAETKVSIDDLKNNYLLEDGVVKHQLIKYKTGKDNVLTDINFAQTTEKTDERMLELSHIINMQYSGEGGYYTDSTGRTKNPGVDDLAVNVLPPAQSSEAYCWRPSGRCFDGYAPVNEDTVFFMVPSDETEINDVTKYKVSNYTMLANDKKYDNMYIYDAGEAGIVSAVVISGAATGVIDANQAVAVVSDIKLTLDADGTEVLSISYMHAGAIKSAVTKAEVNYSINDYYGLEPINAKELLNATTGIGIGDVVYIETNSDGKIHNMYRITDASNVSDMTAGIKNPSSDTYKSARTFYGRMLDMKGTTYEVTDEAGSRKEPISAHYTGTRYTYVDLTAKKVAPVKVTVDYLSRCSNNNNYRLLIKMMNAAVLDCVIYKVQ